MWRDETPLCPMHEHWPQMWWVHSDSTRSKLDVAHDQQPFRRHSWQTKFHLFPYFYTPKYISSLRLTPVDQIGSSGQPLGTSAATSSSSPRILTRAPRILQFLDNSFYRPHEQQYRVCHARILQGIDISERSSDQVRYAIHRARLAWCFDVHVLRRPAAGFRNRTTTSRKLFTCPTATATKSK